LPASLESKLVVEGRAVVIPKHDSKDLAPQILLFSSGDLNEFEYTLQRRGGGLGFRVSPDPKDDEIDVLNLPVSG
jgi:hypothetical protein